MANTLVNSELNLINEKLMIYNRNFFNVISATGGTDGLLNETITLKQPVKLNIPATDTETKHSIDQFGKFIKKIINFNIKNYPDLAAVESELCFVSRTAEGVMSFQENIKNNVISTLKVVNVFVDILEAYKNCIDNKDKTTFDTGYTVDVNIDRIDLVSDKTRFYEGSTMTPSADERNVGYIRPITLTGESKKMVLFLSIQSFNTGMVTGNYNYDSLFTKDGTATASNTNFLNSSAKGSPTTETTTLGNYLRQRYNSGDVIRTTNLSLQDRDRNLVVLLLQTLFGLDPTFRKQSVYALYYYYKFVQLYSTLIINISNVMYNDVKSSQTTSQYRISTFNTATNKKTHGISALEYINNGSVNNDVSITAGGNFTTTGSITPSAVASLSTAKKLTRGKGYLQNPTISTVTPSSVTLNTTIVPMVYTEALSNDDNIERLQEVIREINETITILLDDLSSYSLSAETLIITTPSGDAAPTKVNVKNKRVSIEVDKAAIVNSLNVFNDKFIFVENCIVYDKKNKYSYDIIEIDNSTTGKFIIVINAVFIEADIPDNDRSMRLFARYDDTYYNAVPASATDISSPTDYLELKMKDTNSYKNTYISARNDITDLEEQIGYMTSKVTHQNNLYETHNSKKIFLERQILAYNIILAIIIIILVAINVVNVDKQIVKTISLVCLGVIILLFVIYFISNMTYIETFAINSSSQLYVLGSVAYAANSATDKDGSNSNDATYTSKKIAKLKEEITKLNTRFVSYFEKLIITLPASDNFDFYKEISEIITNDKENKDYTNKTLGYSKNQNDNNINSLKYELENNKLYLNTILISAIIFVGLYNMYINYFKDDKYLYLMAFIYLIIFIIIISYYYITANRRVKTVFNNIYWGPEFSKRF
jgi:hypothetical protein